MEGFQGFTNFGGHTGQLWWQRDWKRLEEREIENKSFFLEGKRWPTTKRLAGVGLEGISPISLQKYL